MHSPRMFCWGMSIMYVALQGIDRADRQVCALHVGHDGAVISGSWDKYEFSVFENSSHA